MPLKASGIEVHIISGKTKEELPPLRVCTTSLDEGEGELVSAKIPSVEGETFKLYLRNTLHKAVKYEVTMDSRVMDEAIIMSRQTALVDGVYSEEGVRAFVFSKLEVKDDDGEADGESFPTVDLSTVGLIEIKVWRVKVTKKRKKKKVIYVPEVKASLDPISEKAKKIGCHGVSLGPLAPASTSFTESVTTISSEHIDPLSQPHVVFRYQYKPQDVLEREGITIPRDRPRTFYDFVEKGDEEDRFHRDEDDEDYDHQDYEHDCQVKAEAEALKASGSRKRSRRS